jgi:uncharacterized protein YeaO (DUF488 family)
MSLRIKRAYELPNEQDGTRILVDRLWPRGLTKPKAHIDLWLKEVAPSPELRKWFAHDPAKWASFRRRYRGELKQHGDQVSLLKRASKEGTVTLVYGARDVSHNGAAVLKELLEHGR